MDKSQSRRRRGVLVGAGMALLLVAPTANARLAATGGASGQGTFPAWYKDSNGLKVNLCLDPNLSRCVLPAAGEEANYDPALAPSFPTNFPSEPFYFLAEANAPTPRGQKGAFLRLATEAAFANEDPAVGDEITFDRLRIRIDGLRRNHAYKITHPYGVRRLKTDKFGVINATRDIGCAGTPCDYKRALRGVIGPYLTWDPSVRPTAPEGFIGNPLVGHRVVGSPLGTNVFKVQDATTGKVVAKTRRFFLMGQMDPATVTKADLAGDDNVTSSRTPSLSGLVGTGAARVRILVDGVAKGTASRAGSSYQITTRRLALGRHRVQAQALSGGSVIATAPAMRINVVR